MSGADKCPPQCCPGRIEIHLCLHLLQLYSVLLYSPQIYQVSPHNRSPVIYTVDLYGNTGQHQIGLPGIGSLHTKGTVLQL